MIPKVIHYCWFGENPLPRLAKKCIKSWKKYCPDYKIIEWNESNFDISSAPLYVRQAYEVKKWAFVTDYVRLKIVYENGGIYLDTDVELIKPLDSFLHYNAYFGFGDLKFINTGLGFGAIKGCEILNDMMKDYKNIPFIKFDGSFDELSCPRRNFHVFEEYGFNMNGILQQIDGICVLSPEYLAPRPWDKDEVIVTENTYSIHHYAASWLPKNYLKNRNINTIWKEDFKSIKKNKNIFYACIWLIKNFFTNNLGG